MAPETDPRAIAWDTFIHPDDRQAYVAAWREAASKGESFEREMRLRRNDGGYRWVRSVGIPRFDASGALTGYSGATFDVHGARQALEALGEADRRKDRFLATLAHELRNPLAPIRTGVQLLRHLDLGDEVAPTLEMMQRQIAVMAHLLDDLLDVGRISRGKLALQRRFVTLGDVVRLAVEAARTEISARDHELSVAIADDSLTLDVDPVRIAQVLTNLLNNAARYTSSPGQVEISAWREDGAVVIAVTDNGRGIAPEDLAELFSPFSRISGGEGGLGLGLALAHTLVEMHGGTLTASSDGLGRGSRFVVRLPL